MILQLACHLDYLLMNSDEKSGKCLLIGNFMAEPSGDGVLCRFELMILTIVVCN